jgi:methylated-DNA-protein-cysteine methyltransferase-like protein
MNANPDVEHLYPRIYDVVRQIPPGRVATYGQIAAVVGPPVDARMVGWALGALKAGSGVPWQRVINAQGKISFRKHTTGHDRQRMRLEAEGVTFDARDRIDLAEYGWQGPDPAWLAEHGYPPPGETTGEEQPKLL